MAETETVFTPVPGEAPPSEADTFEVPEDEEPPAHEDPEPDEDDD